MKANIIRRPRVECFVKTITRVKDAASGNVAYTGVGFKPSALVAFTQEQGGAYAGSIGLGIVGSQKAMIRSEEGGSFGMIGFGFIDATNDGHVNNQTATVASLDSDGFTLAWTKSGAGSNADIDVLVLCLR